MLVSVRSTTTYSCGAMQVLDLIAPSRNPVQVPTLKVRSEARLNPVALPWYRRYLLLDTPTLTPPELAVL